MTKLLIERPPARQPSSAMSQEGKGLDWRAEGWRRYAQAVTRRLSGSGCGDIIVWGAGYGTETEGVAEISVCSVSADG